MTNSAAEPDLIEGLLVEELQDLLDAEEQSVKLLPNMVKAARSEALRLALQQHLDETRTHVERLNEVSAWWVCPRPRPAAREGPA